MPLRPLRPNRQTPYAELMPFVGLVSLLALLAIPLPGQSLNGLRIDAYAGSDPIRDGGPAIEGLLNTPTDVAADSAGNVYVADELNGLVRRVGADGVISTVAGTVERIGSGPLAVEQTFRPDCVAVSPDNRLHFCASRRVYELLPDGTTRVVAGTGSTSGAGDGQPAVDAGFVILEDIDFGPDGSLYILDRGADRVRRVAPDGIIEAFAGNGEEGFSGDGGPAADAMLSNPGFLDAAPDGGVLIVDSGNSRIRRVDVDGVIATVAGNGASGSGGDDGPAVDAALSFPTAVVADADGGFFIAGFSSIRRVDADGVITFWGGVGSSDLGDGGPVGDASFRGIQALDMGRDGALYIADAQNHRIRRVAADEVVDTFAGGSHWLGDGGPAVDAQLFEPRGLALGDAGALYIADTDNAVVRRVDPDGTISTVAGRGETGLYGQEGPATEVRLRAPIDVAIHPVTNELFILDAADGRVRRVNSAGVMTTVVGNGQLGNTGDGGPATEAQIQFPQTISFDAAGAMYLSDIFAHVVRKVSGGTITTIAGTGTAGSEGDGGPAADAQLNRPFATVAVESGELFIADAAGIRRVAADGTISLLAELSGPATYLSLTPDGDLLASVPNRNELYRVSQAGDVEQLATFAVGSGGDGGQAAQARMAGLAAAIQAPDGRYFLTDEGNHRVRLLASGPVLAGLPVRQAASFFAGDMSPETIVSLFGSNLADETVVAESTPLPTSLAGTEVIVRDSEGSERAADLFFVSPSQINLMIPAGSAFGDGEIIVRTAGGAEASAPLGLTTATPGVFAANANGRGVAAAFALRVAADGTQTTEPVFELSESGDSFVPAPIDLGPEGEEVYLILFGTGLRGASSVRALAGDGAIPTLFFGPQGGFVGLDQINVGPLPRSLEGAGEIPIQLQAAGRASNSVTITVR